MSGLLNHIVNDKVKGDSFDDIKAYSREVYMYGAGNLAENILLRMNEYGIELKGVITDSGKEVFFDYPVFQIDDFEKNNKKSVDLVIGFASGYQCAFRDRIRKMTCFNRIYEIANPFIHHKHFDYDFIKRYQTQLEETYNLFADDYSRECFVAFINSRINENADYVRDKYNSSCTEFKNDVCIPNEGEVFLDIGAYKGASIKRFLGKTNGNYKKIIAIEADSNFCEKIKQNCKGMNIKIINMGAWDKKTTLMFKNDDKCSRVGDDGEVKIDVDAIDNMMPEECPTYVYLGISAGETQILKGMEMTIRKNHPKLVVFYGASKEELIEIPQLIKSIESSYNIYIRFINSMPSRLFLYAI